MASCSDMIPWLEAGFINEGDVITATDSDGNPVSIKVNDKEVVVEDGSPTPAKLTYDENDSEHDPDKGYYVLKLEDNDDTRYVMHVDYEGNTTIEQRFTYEKDGRTITEMIPVTTEKVTLTTEKEIGKGNLFVDETKIMTKTNRTYLKGSKVALSIEPEADYSFTSYVKKSPTSTTQYSDDKTLSTNITLNDKTTISTLFFKESAGPLGAFEDGPFKLGDDAGASVSIDSEGKIEEIETGTVKLKPKNDSEPTKSEDGSWEYELDLDDPDSGDATYVVVVGEDGEVTLGQKTEDGIIEVTPEIVTLNIGQIGKGSLLVDNKRIATETQMTYLKGSKATLAAQEDDVGKYEFNSWIEKDKKIAGLHNSKDLSKVIVVDVEGANVQGRFVSKDAGPLERNNEIELDFSGNKEKTEINYDDEGEISGITIGEDGNPIELNLAKDPVFTEEDGSWEYEFTLDVEKAGDATYVVIVEEDGTTTFGQKVDGEDELIQVEAILMTLTVKAMDVFGEKVDGKVGTKGIESTDGKVKVDKGDFELTIIKKYLKGTKVQVMLNYDDKSKAVTFLNWEIEDKYSESSLKETIRNLDNSNNTSDVSQPSGIEDVTLSVVNDTTVIGWFGPVFGNALGGNLNKTFTHLYDSSVGYPFGYVMANPRWHTVTVHHWDMKDKGKLQLYYGPQPVGNRYVVFYENKRVFDSGWVGTAEKFSDFNNDEHFSVFRKLDGSSDLKKDVVTIGEGYPYVTIWVLESPDIKKTNLMGWEYWFTNKVIERFEITFDFGVDEEYVYSALEDNLISAYYPLEPPENSNEDWYDGWEYYKNPGFTEKVEDTDTVTEDMTIYAKEVDIYAIGDTGPAGGIIFYTTEFTETDSTGGGTTPRKYLEAALNDLSGTYQWGGAGTLVSGTEDAIGSGKSNTEKIVNKLGAGSYAAKEAQEYNGGGFNDWFLPSKEELNLMYTNLYENDKGEFDSTYGYWSSSEVNGTTAWYQNFSLNDHPVAINKYQECRVRPVRSF